MVLLGTVAEGLVTQAPCDVLVARSKAAFRRP
jgi:nucleotide-binding universal stress UspA family protein